jgi:hypothetical protein
MKAWKKIVIGGSITIIAGVIAYYVWASYHVKKIKDRGFIITIKQTASTQPVSSYPE